MTTVLSFKKEAEKFQALAKECGVSDNPLFVSTYERYIMQIQVLKKLSAAIRTCKIFVEKKYSKDVKNIYINPAVPEFSKAADAANKTAATMVRIISILGFKADKGDALDDWENEGG